MGRNISSPKITSNIIYLLDAAFLGIVGNRLFYHLFIRDKKNQIALEEANAKLKELDKAKSAFFANISHELKTPMTLVLTPLESALQKARAGETVPLPKGIIESIRHNAYRLSTLISDLLDLTRGEVGKARIRPAPLDKPTAHFEKLVRSVTPLLDEKGIDYELKIYPYLKPHRLDTEKVDKILLNLISNAAKFTPSGGKVVIRVWDEASGEQGEGSETLRIEVADTGIGIPEDKLPHIFERLMQVDVSSTRNYGGLGIGLSLVKEFAEQHGGTVTAESELHHGTRIIVTLPRGQQPSAVTEIGEARPRSLALEKQVLALRQQPKRERPKRLLEAVPGGKERILVVDDNPEMQTTLEGILTDYHVFTASDGEEGIEVARKIKPHLILSDVMMPKKDGYGMLHDLRKEPGLREIPVILLTAKGGEENLALGFEAGADDYIAKPFQPKEVLSRVSNLLRIRKQTEEIRRQKETLHEINHRLRETQEELVQAEKLSAVGVLAGGMAHELNNPVGAIRNYLQDLMESIPKADPNWEILKGAEKATGRCKRIINDLLSFAHESEDLKSLDLNEIVQATFLTARREITKKNVDLVTKPAVDLPHLKADRLQIQQVLMNLIANAVDAIPGSGTVMLRTRQEGGFVVVEVADTGTGIPKNIRGKIFDPFFTTKPPGKGMGLGLAICYNIIHRYHGIIDVESQEGKGTRFILKLPILNPKGGKAHVGQTSEPHGFGGKDAASAGRRR